VEGLAVDGGEDFYGDLDAVARLGFVEEDDGLEVVAQGYAPAVEVDDLGHGTVAFDVEVEPDAAAGEVVAVESFWDFNGGAIPDGAVGSLGGGSGRLP